MPVLIKNEWTLKKLIQNTYHHLPNRFVYKLRDYVKAISIEEVREYDVRVNQKRTYYRITSRSWPQYWPYYTKKDLRGRGRGYQRTYLHKYESIIQLDKLSINVPFKGRVGSDKRWRFGKSDRVKKLPNGRVQEGLNQKLGINGDFFFRCSWVWKQQKILFGRNWADGPPKKVNPKFITFAPKHYLAVIEYLMNKGILKDT